MVSFPYALRFVGGDGKEKNSLGRGQETEVRNYFNVGKKSKTQ